MKAGKNWLHYLYYIHHDYLDGPIHWARGSPKRCTRTAKTNRIRQANRHRQGSPGSERGCGGPAAADQATKPVGRAIKVSAPATRRCDSTGQRRRPKSCQRRRCGPDYRCASPAICDPGEKRGGSGRVQRRRREERPCGREYNDPGPAKTVERAGIFSRSFPLQR